MCVPDDPLHKEPDSLDQDTTHAGHLRDREIGQAKSLGEQSTTGDHASSCVGLTSNAENGDPVTEAIDLTARFAIQRTIGHGGMGEVLEAMDKRLQRRVAIKRIRGEMAGSSTAMARFLREARAVAELNHFNIVQLYDYGRDQEGPFIIMELVEGQSLQERLRDGRFDQDDAIEVICQVCDGLSNCARAWDHSP